MSVIIDSIPFWADWPNSRDTTFDVRATSTQSWVTVEDEFVPANVSRVVGVGSITALRPTIPQITLPATSAGVDSQSARWTVTLHRTGKAEPLFTVLDNFPLNVGFEPVTTWGAVRLFKNNGDNKIWRDTEGFSRTDALNFFNERVNVGNPATTSAIGRVKLDEPPADAASPTVVTYAVGKIINAVTTAALALLSATTGTLRYVTDGARGYYRRTSAGVWRRLLGYADVCDYGAIGDGSSHPLSGLYGSISAAAVQYPFLTTVYAVTITAGGSGYTSATVSASGGGGSGFAATVVVMGGAVVAFNISNPGSGYTSPPTLTISGDGTGATATATVGSLSREIDFCALQQAICDEVGVTSPSMPATKSGTVFVPCVPAGGAYRIDETVRYKGSSAYGLTMRGAVSKTRGPTGSRIDWYGAAGGTMFYAVAMNASLFEDLEFHARETAKYCVHLDAMNTRGSASSGSSGVSFNRVAFVNTAGAGSSLVVAGHVLASGESTPQVDDLNFIECNFQGYGTVGGTEYGYSQLCGGNCRNQKWLLSQIHGCISYGVSLQSGNCIFTGGQVGSNGSAAAGGDFQTTGASLIINGISSEGSFRLLVGTTGTNFASVSVENIQFDNSSSATSPADDVIINYAGSLHLRGNILANRRTAGSVPKVTAGSVQVTPTPGNACGAVFSFGNFYLNAAAGYAPIFDGSANPLLDPAFFYGTRGIAAMSVGDIGGSGGSLVRLKQSIPTGGDYHAENVYMSPVFQNGYGNAISSILTSTTTLTATQGTVLFDSTAGTFIATLPAVSAVPAGRIYILKNVGTANQTTVTGAGADVIVDASGAGSGTYVLAFETRVTLQSDGTKWWVIAK